MSSNNTATQSERINGLKAYEMLVKVASILNVDLRELITGKQ